MDGSGRRLWVRALMLVAAAYAAIGIVFAALPADAHHVRVWRLAAWLASAVVAAAHIWYEQYRLRSSPRDGAACCGGGRAGGLRPRARRKRSLAVCGNTRPTPAAPGAPCLASHHGASGVCC